MVTDAMMVPAEAPVTGCASCGPGDAVVLVEQPPAQYARCATAASVRTLVWRCLGEHSMATETVHQ
ncbi:MAG: hypothetical protein ACK56F_20565, partial [bacterium]